MTVKAVTDIQMREIDRISIEEVGIPASILMNNAGKSVADFIEKKFKEKQISVFCGSGNNGGDGFTAAYYLANRGFHTEIYLTGKKEKVSETSKIFLSLCEKINIKINEIDEHNVSSISVPQNGLVIDAIIGTGFQDSPRGIALEFIKIINNSENTVISIDIPSGLGSNGEGPSGECVHSNYTITIGLPKISIVTYPCREFCGEIIIQDIGFPSFLTSDEKIKVSLTNKSLISKMNIYNTGNDIHKGDKGHTLIIGGFPGMEGAILLTASALFSSGCGLATIATTGGSRSVIAGRIPESMTLSLPENFDAVSVGELFQPGKFSSLIIGPGMGRTQYAEILFRNILASLNTIGAKRVLIDGDGLFHLADFIKHDKLPGGVDFVITPHFMEASRILDKDIETIKNNRLKSCIELAQFTGSTTVLKGPCSVISDGNSSYINTTGNNGLATAGSGDVLSGIIGSFMNMNVSSLEAAAAGVYIHGLCADLYIETYPASTMSGADIINQIKNAIKLTVNTDN